MIHDHQKIAQFVASALEEKDGLTILIDQGAVVLDCTEYVGADSSIFEVSEFLLNNDCILENVTFISDFSMDNYDAVESRWFDHRDDMMMFIFGAIKASTIF
jgi:hypothetical protein